MNAPTLFFFTLIYLNAKKTASGPASRFVHHQGRKTTLGKIFGAKKQFKSIRCVSPICKKNTWSEFRLFLVWQTTAKRFEENTACHPVTGKTHFKYEWIHSPRVRCRGRAVLVFVLLFIQQISEGGNGQIQFAFFRK